MAFARIGDDARWPEGLVPFEISPDFDDGQRRTVRRAVAHWNGRTIMRLMPRAGQADFVRFEPADGFCRSAVGRVTGPQAIGCDVAAGFSLGSVIHEIGHAVGYFHEQQRPDRDQFVDIVEENIEAGKEGNFEVRTGLTLGPYDYGSIMHYPRDAFADGGDTIVPLQDVSIGQREGLSDRDVAGVCLLYQAPHVVVAFEDSRSPGRRTVRWTGLTRWGRRCWGPDAVGERVDGPRSAPNVAVDDDRTAVVVWEDDPDDDGRFRAMARCRTVDGAPRFDLLPLTDAPGSHREPDVGMVPGGDLVAVWQSAPPGGGRQIRARGLDRRGRERWPEVVVADGASAIPAGPAVAVDTGGGFVVAWSELAGDVLAVRAQGFRGDGVARFAPFTVADGLGDQDVVARVAVAGDGAFVVVWEPAGGDVHARGYAADGTPGFGPLTVNGVPGGPALLCDVAAMPGGRFAVVWTDDRDGNGLGQIRSRVFDAGGGPAGPEFTANPRGGGDQGGPRVAIDRAGRVYLVWADDEDGNGVYQVHAQGVEADGTAFLRSFTVNTVWAGQQRRPAVATR
ncbi:MAG TPA: M12 family metallopeptidase [Pseudonocardia sp.]|nr:M12 family metallopeptidase [Pseudonocardia sp.]